MTQQDSDSPSAYNTSSTVGGSPGGAGFGPTRATSVNAAIAYTPTDRVRWPAILAGLFAAISTLALLGALGMAIGLSSYDAGDSARAFAIGSGIWAAITALIAFFVGGFLAARTAALRGRDVGVLNGFMVWAVALPLLAWLAASMVGAAARTAGSALGTATTAASNVARDTGRSDSGAAATTRSAADQIDEVADDAADQIEQRGEDMQRRLESTDRQDVERGVERAADAGRGTAWGTFFSMVLALIASVAGGAVGARDDDDDDDRDANRGR